MATITELDNELGPNPQGIYSNVRVRLDILEARINNPNSPAPNVTNPFYIDGYGGTSISVGDGYPTEDRNNGSLYIRRDGYIQEGLYSRRSNNWYLIPTTSIITNIMDGYYGTFPSATDGYISNYRLLSGANDGNFPAYIVNSTGFMKNLIVTCSQIPTGAEAFIITLRKNLSDTLLSVTLNSSTASNSVGYIASDLINVVDLSFGDYISIKCISSTAAVVSNIKIFFEIDIT